MTAVLASRDGSRVGVWLAAAAVLIGVVTVVAIQFNPEQILPAGKATTAPGRQQT